MFQIIGTKQQAVRVKNTKPKEAYELLIQTVAILDENYGSQRDYTKIGGYCIIADTEEDLNRAELYLDYEQRLYEWEEVYEDIIARLYLLGDDFAIVLFMRGEEQ